MGEVKKACLENFRNSRTELGWIPGNSIGKVQGIFEPVGSFAYDEYGATVFELPSLYNSPQTKVIGLRGKYPTLIVWQCSLGTEFDFDKRSPKEVVNWISRTSENLEKRGESGFTSVTGDIF